MVQPACWSWQQRWFMVEDRSQREHRRIALRVDSNILLNIGAGLVSSIFVYVSLTETAKILAGWLVFLIIASVTIFEWGRVLAYAAER
jgi:hypothetical protein